jgi:hypothetical protein
MGVPLAWHRRHALTIAGQLPENIEDALLVLQATRELVDTFLSKAQEDQPRRAANVLPFGSAS